MSQNNDQNIIDLIQKSPFLMDPEKQYLIEKVPVMGPLDKLKTKKSLMGNTTPDLILEFRNTRAKFIENERRMNPEPPDPNSLQARVFGVKPPQKVILSHSILGQPQFLGTPAPRPQPIPPIRSTKFEEITELFHLNSLTPDHVTFSINDNGEQIVRNFLIELEQKMVLLENPYQKRNVFALFLASPLFKLYLNTGITALKHPEIKPKNTILNTMQKIDRRFLNRSQFEYTSMLTSGIRTMVGL